MPKEIKKLHFYTKEQSELISIINKKLDVLRTIYDLNQINEIQYSSGISRKKLSKESFEKRAVSYKNILNRKYSKNIKINPNQILTGNPILDSNSNSNLNPSPNQNSNTIKINEIELDKP